MPIQNYDCNQCQKQYEYFHLGSDDKVAICPHCGSKDSSKRFPEKVSHTIKGASAKNNYGLKRGR